MLVGRAVELAQIEECLAQAQAGRASALLLVGDPGLGKTALLEAGARMAAGRGMRVVRLAALELEAGIPAAGLGILLPLLGGEVDGSSVSVLLDAMVRACEAGPMLVTLDDVHWLDQQSALALSFALRRLLADPVAVLLAGRPAGQSSTGMFDVARIHLTPLSRTASRALLQEQFPAMPTTTADEIAEALGRVPLPLVEVGHLMTEQMLVGLSPLPSPVPVSQAVQERYARGFHELDGDARLALALLAADDTADPTVVAAAMTLLGLTTTSLDQAEQQGLVRRRPGPAFVHPLARASVHSAAAPAEQRKVHAALGEVLRARADHARAVRHLAAAASGPDPELASELALLAHGRASTPTSRAEASALALMGAELATAPDVREELLVLAAECSQGQQAVLLADQVGRATANLDLRARCSFVRVDEDPRLEPADQVSLLAELDVVDLSPPLAHQRDVRSVWSAMDAADVGRLEALAARHDRADGTDPPWELLGLLGLAFTFLGRNARAVPLLQRAQAASARVDPTHLAPNELVDWAVIPGWLGDDLDHHERFRRMDSLLRSTGRPDATATAAFFSAERARREGDWVRAEALLRESVELMRAISRPAGVELARLASLLAYQGDEETTRTVIAQAQQQFEDWGSPWQRTWLDQASGALLLTLGRAEDAIRALEPLNGQTFLGRGCRDALATGLVDLVEAYVAAGDVASAQDVARDLARRLDSVVDPFGPAMVARCRALASLGDADEQYGLALDCLGRTSEVFETARTELLYGEHLRRTRRPREARPLLSGARTAFGRVRARPWAERARNELAAAGERTPETRLPAVGLTAQELRVALAVTEGLTNAQVASGLFLSVKTVEFHLGNVYRKLGVRSRGGLAKALAGSGLVPT